MDYYVTTVNFYDEVSEAAQKETRLIAANSYSAAAKELEDQYGTTLIKFSIFYLCESSVILPEGMLSKIKNLNDY